MKVLFDAIVRWLSRPAPAPALPLSYSRLLENVVFLEREIDLRDVVIRQLRNEIASIMAHATRGQLEN